MRHRILPIVLLLSLAASAFASTLTVAPDHRTARYGTWESPQIMRVVFTGDPLSVEVKLNIYAVPQLASSRERLAELQALPDEGWWRRLEWRLVNTATGRVLPEQQWTFVRSSADKRGPGAGDKSKVVDWRTLSARFTLPAGTLPPGDYTIGAAIAGLSSGTFPFVVRTGAEEEVRDTYLASLAERANDFPTYRRLQLERAARDPMNASALLLLAERSIEQGTLQETLEYFDRAIAAMELPLKKHGAKFPAWAKKEAPEIQYRIGQYRAIQRALPEYFAHRKEWRLAYDTPSRRWVILSRKDRQIIRAIPAR